MSDLIDEYVRHLQAECKTPASLQHYRWLLERMDRELPAGLACATTDELRDWIHAGNRSRATLANYTTVCRGFFAWATDPASPVLDFDSSALLPAVKLVRVRRRALADDDLEALLARTWNPYRTWLTIAAYTGARCIELSRLDRHDIGRDVTLLRGKGDRDRDVPTHPRVWQVAQELPTGPVCVDRYGRRLDRRQISRRANHHLHAELGLDSTHMHRLRRTFATRAYRTDRDVMAVRDLMGHADVNTTQGYIETNRDAMRRAVAAL